MIFLLFPRPSPLARVVGKAPPSRLLRKSTQSKFIIARSNRCRNNFFVRAERKSRFCSFLFLDMEQRDLKNTAFPRRGGEKKLWLTHAQRARQIYGEVRRRAKETRTRGTCVKTRSAALPVPGSLRRAPSRRLCAACRTRTHHRSSTPNGARYEKGRALRAALRAFGKSASP